MSQVVHRIVLEFGFVLFVVKLLFVVNSASVRETHSNDPGYYRDFQQQPVTAGNPLIHFFLDVCLHAQKTSCETLAEELLLATLDTVYRTKERFSGML